MEDDANPLDDLPDQIQGRLQTLEVLVTLLVAQKAGATRMLKQASTILDVIEDGAMKGASDAQQARLLRVMNVARHSLDGITRQVRGLS